MTDFRERADATIYALAHDMAERGLFVRDDFGEPNIHAINEIRNAFATALAAADREATERAAEIAANRESPWSEVHPQETYVNRLQNIIGGALLSAWNRADDNEPEHTIAEAVFDFLRIGQSPLDKLFGAETIAAAIRAAAKEGT